MTEIFQKHKKACMIGTIIAVVIFAIYIYALFLRGYWYGDVFLYKKSEMIFGSLEVYSGRDVKNNADYEMVVAREEKTTMMSFTVNETERYYEIISDDSEGYYPAVTIFENEDLVFIGTYTGYLKDENGEPFEPPINISYGTYVPTEEELFPSYNWLYGISQSLKTETRGDPLWLIAIVIFTGIVLFDMAFPDLLWEWNHWLDTKGGEPSEFYRFSQKALWVIAPILILISMIVSFIPDMFI